MFGFDVDRRQNPVVAHAGQQPEPADTGARPHLDDGLRAADLGQHAQKGADRGTDRTRPCLDGTVARSGDDGVLGDRVFGVVDDRLGAVGLRLARRVIGHARSVEGSESAATATRPSPDRPDQISDHIVCPGETRVTSVTIRFLRESSVGSYASHTTVGNGNPHGTRRTLALWE